VKVEGQKKTNRKERTNNNINRTMQNRKIIKTEENGYPSSADCYCTSSIGYKLTPHFLIAFS
jgi:hypothetical protein